ncbi:MAG: Na+/H+ antiporter subunit D [Anaerolineae bacterium]
MDNNPFLLGPVFFPFIGVILSLVAARANRAQRYIGLVTAGMAWLCSIVVLYQNWDTGSIQTYNIGSWPAPYGVVFVGDMLSGLFSVMITTVMLGGFLYTIGCADHSITYPAFMPLFLGMEVGLEGAVFTGDLFTFFVFIELTVITSVTLVAISDNRLGLEAAMKYLLISAMGSLFLQIGIAAIYAAVGTLNMADISVQLQVLEAPLLLRAAAVMLLAAFLLKSAVFPFHFWQPDFHTTAPTPVGAMLSSVVVKVGIYMIIRMVTLLFVGETAIKTVEDILIVLGIIGIFFGSLGALRTYNAKRMLAYSTFGQVGFILVGIGWASPVAMLGAIIYAFNHAFIKSSLLMLTGVVSSRTKSKTGTLAQLVGVGQKMRWTGILYFLGGLSLAGVPPLNGFISKVALLRGGINVSGWVALGLVVSAGVITLLYMTRTWSLIFQQAPVGESAPLKPAGSGDSVLAPALLIFICVLLGLYAAPLVEVAQMTVDQIFQPAVYINAVLG